MSFKIYAVSPTIDTVALFDEDQACSVNGIIIHECLQSLLQELSNIQSLYKFNIVNKPHKCLGSFESITDIKIRYAELLI